MSTPPFDGKPCPMCPQEIRNLSATVHNFLWRWDQWMKHGETHKVHWKMTQVGEAVQDCRSLINGFTDARVRELYDQAERFVVAFQTWKMSPSHETYESLKAAGVKLRQAYTPIQALADTHFADRFHSHGEVWKS